MSLTFRELFLLIFFISAAVANHRNQTILILLEDNLFKGYWIAHKSSGMLQSQIQKKHR